MRNYIINIQNINLYVKYEIRKTYQSSNYIQQFERFYHHFSLYYIFNKYYISYTF